MSVCTAFASEVTGSLSTGLNANTGQVVDGTVISPPIASPTGGSYSSAQSVTLAAAGSTSIRYSLNGTTPSCSLTAGSVAYSLPISVGASVTIKAVSCYPNNNTSTVAEYIYTINIPFRSSGGGTDFVATSVVSSTSTKSNTPKGEILGESVINSHPNGTLILDGATIYLIKDNQRHGFRDAEEYASYGYKFDQAVPIIEADKLLPEGEIIKAMTGSLVLDKSDSRTVFMIGKNYTKRGFVSYEVFQGLGYTKPVSAGKDFGAAAEMKTYKINLADYPAGQPVASSTEAHPDGALVMDSSGTVWWILDGRRSGFESLSVFGSYGFSFDRVVAANGADMTLAQGSLVKFRDGTLVKDGSDYYIISDGLKLKFSSASTLTGWGYQLHNVIFASLASYAAGAVLK